jgi:hypothetical protein
MMNESAGKTFPKLFVLGKLEGQVIHVISGLPSETGKGADSLMRWKLTWRPSNEVLNEYDSK